MSTLPTKTAIRNSYREQAQRSQAHRWLSLCLTGDSDGSELLSESARTYLNGESVPLDAGCIDIAQRHSWSIHQHGIGKSTQITIILDHLRLPTTTQHTAAHVQLGFDSADPLLPSIESIRIEEVANAKLAAGATRAQDLTPHRILALKHRWHALVEAPDKVPEAFQSIMADGFQMDWGQGSVSDYGEFSAWLRGSASSVSAARHDIADFTWSRERPDRYRAEFTFDWAGLSADEQPMQAQSRHVWAIEDDHTERYARIAQMNVELLVPFHIVKGARS